MRLSLIAAVADNGVIGYRNRLPWRLPRDLRRFRALTMGHHLILGRKTFESIGKPLDGRHMIVLTRRSAQLPSGVKRAHSLDEAVATARTAEDGEAFVGGGEEIYRLALPRADRLYLTRVHCSPAGDARFPDFDKASWAETEREHYPVDDDNPVPITFLIFDRRQRPVE